MQQEVHFIKQITETFYRNVILNGAGFCFPVCLYLQK